MCGIAGIINLSGSSLDFKVLKDMTRLQGHRGPDHQGFGGFSLKSRILKELNHNENEISNELDGGVGFNRLSIVDLSNNANQPMICYDANVMLAFNGEIYNAFDFKDHLVTLGYKFRSNSDTEVLLYLYVEYGIKGLLEKIKGMFSFVIVDANEKTIFIARDHFGIKPMYTYQNSDLFLFSSEIKSFYAHPLFKNELNVDNLTEYLMFKFCSGENTLLKNVKQLAPATYLEIKENDIRIYKYWKSEVFFNNQIEINKNVNDKVEQLLDKSIKSQLLGDVKIGCQLSGGIDSSLVTFLARENYDANMDAFSIIFEDKKYSEENWIDYASENSKTNSHKFFYENNYTADNIFSATWHLDTPINLPNTLGIKLLAKKSSKFVKVLLSGEGADELFCGYERFFNSEYRIQNKYILNILSSIPLIKTKLINRFKLRDSDDKYMLLSPSSISQSELNKLFFENNYEEVVNDRLSMVPNHLNNLQKFVYYEMNTWLVDLLVRQDKMMMAHSIENRVPFLDKDLVEYVFKNFNNIQADFNPNIFKINKSGLYTKSIIKKIASKYFNGEFVYRSKSGFPLPLYDLFYKSEMNQLINDDLMPSIKNRDILNYDFINDVWISTKNNPTRANLKNLWMIISFEIWAKLFLDKNYVN